MFKKTLACILGAVLSTGVLVVDTMAAEKVFKVGIGDPIDSGAGAMGLKFKEIVEAKSGGKVRVELFPNCALGDELEMLQNARRGTLDMAIIGIGNAVPFVPELGALTLPYLLETEAEVVKATTGEMFNTFNNKAIKAGGIRILGYTYCNFRHLTNSKRTVTSMKDAANLKIRVPNNQIFLASFKTWGLNPVPMAWAETFTALQQGVVDGQDNPYVVNHTMKFQEIQKYVTELHYHYSLQPMFIGEKNFAKLDPALQKMLTEAGMEAQMYSLQWENDHAVQARKAMEEAGVVVSTLTDEAQWRKQAVEKVWPQFYDFIGGKAVLDNILTVLDKQP